MEGDRDQEKDLRSSSRVFDCCGDYLPMWRTVSAISFVLAVSVDPLFLYIPILEESKKCLGMDRKLKMIAVVLRSVVDLTYVTHIVFMVRCAFLSEISAAPKRIGLQRTSYYSFYWDRARMIRWSDVIIDFFAILPFPQVLILTYFTKVRSLRSLITSKVINFFVLVQYIPRILRVYISCQNLKTTPGLPHNRVIHFGAILNVVLYIVASHVLGGFWYFFSIQRVTACWHHAYKSNQTISLVSDCFVCRQNHTLSSSELLILSKVCHSNPPNVTAFDYGIFGDAIQSGILKKTSFLKKFVRCFWWGLRNVSSYGQNLQTSSNEWETCFAVCISITALLLYIYLIGNLQMYFQMAAARSEEAVQRMRRIEAEIDMWVRSYSLPANQKASIMQQIQRALEDNRETFDLAILRSLLVDRIQRINNNSIEDGLGSMMKEEKAEEWMLRNEIPDEIKRDIMPYVRSSLQENEDVDLKIMLSILPRKHKMSLKRHLCFAVLKRVPMLRDMDDIAVETICEYLRPVIYPENSRVIQQGEPLDVMFFITEGVAWTYMSNNRGDMSISSTACLERGDFYGDKELLQWTLNNDNTLSNIPISTTNVKAHTKVEALALRAADLRHLVSATSTAGSSSSSASGAVQIKME